MRTPFKVSSNHWKTKCQNKTKEKRQLKAEIARLRAQVRHLQSKSIELRCLTEAQKLKKHHYPVQMIAMAVFIVVHAGGSLRCAAKTIGFLSQLMGWSYGQPSHVTIRNWVLRCGLYQLDHAKAKAGRYVGIIDESIQIGREKMLLFLGIKLSDQSSHYAPLTMQDVVVLGVEVQQSWTGSDIAQFIDERLEQQHQIDLQYVISDRGTNLLAALRLAGLDIVGDCSHMMMNVVKKLFKGKEDLSVLAAHMGKLRSNFILTDLNYLVPPTLRDKDRFLRIFTIHDWAERINAYWAKLSSKERKTLGFIRKARPLLQCLAQIRTLIELTAGVLKSAGLSASSQQSWEDQITRYTTENKLTNEAQIFLEAVRKYFAEHAAVTKKHERLLCCSDIIESTFGRYKNKGGMNVISADVLSIALYQKPVTNFFIIKALTSVHQKDIQNWHHNYTCDNRFSILSRMNKELKSVA